MEDQDPIDVLFERHKDEFLKFDRVTEPRCSRPDLHAFIRLHELVQSAADADYEARNKHKADIISGAEHDQIWLSVDIDRFREVMTDELVIELSRCGVFYDTDINCLSMFV